MRIAYLRLIGTAPLVGGCSTLIASAGRDLTCTNTTAAVRAQMGELSVSGVKDGKEFDEYHTRRNISERETVRLVGLGMGFGMTCGASEIIACPCELCTTGRRTLVGQEVRFIYDPEGKVIDRLLDGKSLDYVFFSGVEIVPLEPTLAATDKDSVDPPSPPP